MRYVSRGDRLAFWISALLAVVGLSIAFRGGMPWWPGIMFAIFAASLVLWSDLATNVDDIVVSDQGVRRTYGPRLWVKKVEAISWDALQKVEMATDASDAEETCFLLYGPGGAPMTVADAYTDSEWLVMQMQKRLPGFDDRSVDEAYGRAKSGPVLVWQRSASGQG